MSITQASFQLTEEDIKDLEELEKYRDEEEFTSEEVDKILFLRDLFRKYGINVGLETVLKLLREMENVKIYDNL